MKKTRILYFYVLSLYVLFPLLLYSILVTMPNSVWHGFGVDSSQRVYIGKKDQIDCYINGEKNQFIPYSRIQNLLLYCTTG